MQDSQDQPAATPPASGQTSARQRTFLVVVDNSEEMAIALRYACLRARRSGGRVALLYVTEPAEPGPWMAVEELVREERRQEAEQVLSKWAELVQEIVERMPVVYVREGDSLDAIMKLVEEEPGISILVLAAAAGDSPGPLVSALPRTISRLRIPVTIVPGSLNQSDLDGLT
jgi:nucleotide-binding universal stress UspA family protein